MAHRENSTNEIEGLMLILVNPNHDEKRLLWYRIGTACLAVYCFFLGLSLSNVNTNDLVTAKYTGVGRAEVNALIDIPWKPLMEYPFPCLCIISALLLLPPIWKPCFDFRSYLLPAVLINMYLAVAYAVNVISVAHLLLKLQVVNNLPYNYLLYATFFLATHLVLTYTAKLLYDALWPADDESIAFQQVNQE